jgi:nitrate reductase gamma subunit
MMDLLFLIGDVLPYVTLVVFLGGIIIRTWKWLALPVPTKIMVAPAPLTQPGVAVRLGSELLVFRSLMKADWKLWFGGWLFHVLLGVTVLTHVINIFFPGVWVSMGYGWYEAAGYAGILFAGMVAFLLLRRIVHPGVRYVSKPSDYGLLLLLFSVIFLGDYTRNFSGVDVAAVSTYLQGLISFQQTLPPANLAFLTHLLLAQIFLIYLPFSKIVHFVGWVLAPTRNQRNDARARLHINPWNPTVDIEPWESYAERYRKQLDELGPGGERR